MIQASVRLSGDKAISIGQHYSKSIIATKTIIIVLEYKSPREEGRKLGRGPDDERFKGEGVNGQG